jgi:iron complex outermembrane receptor protein
MIGYEFEHRFNDVFTVRQNARYSYIHTDYFNPAGSGWAVGSPTATTAVLNRRTLSTHPTLGVFNVDNQLESHFFSGPLQHTVLFGVDYKRVSFEDRSGFGLATPGIDVLNPQYNQTIPNVPISTNIDTTQSQLGVYLQDQIKLDRWTLVLSGRQDFVRTNNVNNLTPANSRVGNDSAFSGRAGLIYTSDIGLAPYVSYTRSFQPNIGLNAGTNQPLVPETGEQYEVGVKYQPVGSKSFIGVAAFDLTRQNFLTNNPSNFLEQTQNGEARSRGIEVEAVAQLSEGLRLVGAFTAFDIKTTQSLDVASIGKVPVSVPEQFGSLFVDYTIQSGTFRGLGFGAGIRYNGPSYADTANTFEVPSYVLGDAVLHYDRDNWRLALNATNLFDKTYVGICGSVNQCFYGERRKVLASVGYRW